MILLNLEQNVGKEMRTFTNSIIIFSAVFVLIFACNSTHLRYSVVYLDLDGTTLDTTNIIRESTIHAAKAFIQRGGRLGIATGRTFEQAEQAIHSLKPNLPIVLFNGGIIADANGKNSRVIGNLDKEAMDRIILMLSDNPEIYGYILHFPTVSIIGRQSDELQAFARSYNITLTLQDNFQNLSADSLVKILVVCPDGTAEAEEQKLAANMSKNARTVISSDHTFEIIPETISKAVALEQICANMGFEMEDIVAFGDSGNDVEMLSSVGLGVAMWNGRPEAKAAADIIIGPNYSDAIAKFLSSPIMK